MFEGDSADMSAWKFRLMSMRGREEGLACPDPGARTPIGVSGNLPLIAVVNCIVWPIWHAWFAWLIWPIVRNIKVSNSKHEHFPLALMGVLAPGSAHAWPSTQPPIDTSGNFSAHMFAKSASKTSLNPFRSHTQIFKTLEQLLNFVLLLWVLTIKKGNWFYMNNMHVLSILLLYC